MTKRQLIDVILQENATDCANTYGLSMTEEDKKNLNARWKKRLLRMRQIDRGFCEVARFKINE